MTIDHRAEAETLVRGINAQLTELSSDLSLLGEPHVIDALNITLKLAEVHATLAAGLPVADQHVQEAARDGVALRRAVLEHLKVLPRPADAQGDVWSAWVDRLRELVGEHPGGAK